MQIYQTYLHLLGKKRKKKKQQKTHTSTSSSLTKLSPGGLRHLLVNSLNPVLLQNSKSSNKFCSIQLRPREGEAVSSSPKQETRLGTWWLLALLSQQAIRNSWLNTARLQQSCFLQSLVLTRSSSSMPHLQGVTLPFIQCGGNKMNTALAAIPSNQLSLPNLSNWGKKIYIYIFKSLQLKPENPFP